MISSAWLEEHPVAADALEPGDALEDELLGPRGQARRCAARPLSAAWPQVVERSRCRAPSWSWRTVLGPSPGIRSSSTRLGGTSARSLS